MLDARAKLPKYSGTVWRGVKGVDLRAKYPKGKVRRLSAVQSARDPGSRIRPLPRRRIPRCMHAALSDPARTRRVWFCSLHRQEFYWWAFSSTTKELSTLQNPQVPRRP